MNMRIYLIFPPVSPQFRLPYLSIPALGAYLKQEEPSWNVRMSDQNIELARKVLSPEGINRFKATFWECAKNNSKPLARRWFKDHHKRLLKIEAFLRKYPGGWRESAKIADEITRLFLFNELLRAEIWLNEVLLDAVNVERHSHAETIEWAESYPEGIMTEYFRNEFVPEIMAFNPALLGFSWIDHGQIIPTLVLLKILKEKGFQGRTVVGGPYISLIWDRLPSSPILGRIDHFVTRQGEEPLLRLARSVAAGKSAQDIGQLIEPENPDISKLPAPDFGDFKFESYLSGELRLCLLGSWGCYWGDCSFCNVRKLEGIRYKPRRPDQIVDDIIAIKERYHPDNVRLSDNAIAFHTMVRIAEELISRKVELPWITNTRFDGNWTAEGVKLLAESRCIQLLFGLESASENILKLVNKGTDLDRVRHILSLIEPTPILAHFYMIVGYPSETREDWKRTIGFFKGISRQFPRLRFSIHLAGFGLQIQSHMYNEPEKHHIVKVIEPDMKGWSTLCQYDVSPDKTNILKEPAIFYEMKAKLDSTQQEHLKRQQPLKHRILNRLRLQLMKIKLRASVFRF